VAPAGLGQQRSVQAEMEADHADDILEFAPGLTPVPLAAPAASLALAPAAGSIGTASLLGLADPSQGRDATLAASLPNGLRKEVLGFLPYWMLSADELQWMQYDLVSTIAYFGVAAQSDGTLATYSTGWAGWNSSAMTGVINAAHSRGVRVVLTVTMMAWDGGAQQAALLGSAEARTVLVNAIVAAVRDRNADGVNLDFEPVAIALRDQYTSFVQQLKAVLVAAGVGSYLTVCTMAGAATWATGYDLPGLVAPGAADELFVMGYDYSWSGSARAGGVAPMDASYMLDVNESVVDYLKIVPGSKIIWGVPYYGRTWLTQSDSLNAFTVAGASGSSKAYYYVGNLVLSGRYGRLWDAVGRVPWFRYYDSVAASWVEGYYDDAASLAEKWDMVNQRDLAGTGMWTLLMDQGSSDLWNLLAAKFVIEPPSESETYDPPRTLYFAAGTYVGRQFSATGAIIASLAYTLAGASNAPTSQRSTIPNQPGAWYHITAGVWAGYWIQESEGTILGPAPPPPTMTFVPLTPARLLDSRFGNGLSGPFNAGVPRTFQVSGRGGVPANATAVTGTLTATNPTQPGFVFLGPDPVASPTSSTLNFPLGDTRANGVTVALSPTGSLSATFGYAGSTDLIFDVTGYFVE
jgi:spore germination protein YaaH